MKYIIIILINISIFSSSCSKDNPDRKYCWDCISTTTGSTEYTYEFEECDYTQAEIDELERSMKSSFTSGTYHTSSSTSCTKKR